MGGTHPSTTDRSANPANYGSDITILGGNRDHRFRAGLRAVLTGPVTPPRAPIISASEAGLQLASQ